MLLVSIIISHKFQRELQMILLHPHLCHTKSVLLFTTYFIHELGCLWWLIWIARACVIKSTPEWYSVYAKSYKIRHTDDKRTNERTLLECEFFTNVVVLSFFIDTHTHISGQHCSCTFIGEHKVFRKISFFANLIWNEITHKT